MLSRKTVEALFRSVLQTGKEESVQIAVDHIMDSLSEAIETAAKRDAERQDRAARFGFEHPKQGETPRTEQEASLLAAIDGNYAGMSHADLVHTAKMLHKGRQLWRERAETAERRVSELEAALAEKSRGAERANEVTPQELGALVDRLDGVGVAWCTEADFATLLSAAKRDAERQDQAARYGFEPAETVLKTVQRVLDENSAWIAMPNREVEQRIALAVGFAASVAQEQLRHELMGRAESAERRVSELEATLREVNESDYKKIMELKAALAEKSRDAERYQALKWQQIFHYDADDAGSAAEEVDAAADKVVEQFRVLRTDNALAAERKEGKHG